MNDNLWETLVTAALLGTERHSVELPTTQDGPLGAVLSGLQQQHSGNSEHLLLSSAAALSLYQQAGWLPIQDANPLPTIAPAETLPTCSDRAGIHLYTMLAGEYGPALSEWLEAAARFGKLVPQNYLASILFLGQAQPTYRQSILPVIGNRGRWLASLYTANGEWAYVRDAASIEAPGETTNRDVWETGSPEARLTVLLTLRATQPDLARDMLSSVWKVETASTRTSLLSALATGLSMADETFLETCLDDKSKEARSTAADLLAQLPQSAFMQRMIDGAIPCLNLVRVKQGRLFAKAPNKDHIEVTLPAEYTAPMKRDGIDQKPPGSNLGERAFWLVQQLSRIPPRVWVERWSAEPAEIITAASQTKEWKEMLLQSWLLAAIRHNDQSWAEAYLAQGFARISEYSSQQLIGNALDRLLAMLPPARRNDIVTSTLTANPGALYTDDMPLNVLWTLQKPWPIDVCRAVLRGVSHHLRTTKSNNNWQLSQSLSNLAYSMSPAILQEAEAALITNDRTSKNLKDAVDEFLATLQFRRDMLQALAE